MSRRKPTTQLKSAAPAAEPAAVIALRGVRTHNLQGFDLDLPRQQVVVVTGVSGSGKSSLVYDTLHAEAQRRFLATLGGEARAWLEQLPQPQVDGIRGLPPTVAIDQRGASRNPRSTLATLTEIHDHLRLLFARSGQPHCINCHTPISRQSLSAISDEILSWPEGTRLMLLAPVGSGDLAEVSAACDEIRRQGLVRARIDGQLVEINPLPALTGNAPHHVEAVVDRLIVKPGLQSRLDESLALTMKLGQGRGVVVRSTDSGWQDWLCTTRWACPQCGLTVPEIEPRTFSFFSPHGACPECHGLGYVTQPPVKAQEESPKTKTAARKTRPQAARSAGPTDSGPVTCPTCRGTRLTSIVNHVFFAGQTLPQTTALTVSAASELVASWHRDLAARQLGLNAARQAVAEKVLPQLAERLSALLSVGLDYLTLDRPVTTLAGGEWQRGRLAGCLAAGLSGVCYLLDEPTTGLHPRDTQRLWDVVQRLSQRGATICVVEHDLDVIQQADWIIELGPGAGREGGQLVAQGTPASLLDAPASSTGNALRCGPLLVPASGSRPAPDHWLTLQHARLNNLQDVTLQVPLRQLVCITGVSGSGKSTLISDCLVPALRRRLTGETSPLTGYGELTGGDELQRLAEVDQSPLGRGGRSCVATAIGAWDHIRRILSHTREAKLRGWTASHFSLQHAAGRCPACHGHGWRSRTAGILGELPQICPACQGRRFAPTTLEIKYRNLSAADILDLSLLDACDFFAPFETLRYLLQTGLEVGLGHLTLGQPTSTLSGGESQRIKLVAELGQPQHFPTLFVLDEPTSGLHQRDIVPLVALLQRLVERDHSVIVVEHHPALWSAADWIVDLGPGGGVHGGRIVAAGTPEEVSRVAESATGQELRRLLGRPTPGAPI